jgi:hypothetical protein
MHSREGLETEYLGYEWMECIKKAIETAKAEGMGAWLYDEDNWPSGMAGGLVQKLGGDACRAKGLTIEILNGKYEDDGKVIALFSAVLDGEKILSCKRLEITDDCTPEEGEVLLVFRSEIPGILVHEDAPIDTLNPESIRLFIETTYDAYKREVGDEFGKSIPGIFTDEPNVADGYGTYPDGRAAVQWSDGLADYFKIKRGYDILDVLPYIFLEGEKSDKVRHDYWRTISDMFSEAYSKQLGEWCERNGLALTGHYMHENVLWMAVKLCGSMMPHYRYMHIPGIDLLANQIDEYLTVKQCTSVANQYGRERVISEMYGCTGWDFTFEGQKWLGDWQYVMGVNLRCQHLALYSLKGCRKRDFPPSINYNTPWWKEYKPVEDYFARISAVLTQGRVDRDVLVIHPSSTAWSMMGWLTNRKENLVDREFFKKLIEYGQEMNDFAKYLLEAHYDFDFGDETIMEETGKVKDGKFYVNQAGYTVVVIPPVRTLFRSTVNLLKEFIELGGTVIAVDPLPTMIEGETSQDVAELLRDRSVYRASGKEEVVPLLERVLPRRISIRGRDLRETPQILHMLRETPDYHILFMVNTDRNNAYNTVVSLDFTGEVEEWDLLTGQYKKVDVKVKGNGISFRSVFEPIGSRLYIINKNKQPTDAGKDAASLYFVSEKTGRLLGTLGPVCRFARTWPNALTLDRCSYSVNGKEWSAVMDVWQAQKNIREELEMRQVYKNGIMQRYKWVNEPHPRDGTPASFKFVFNVKEVPENDVYLALEASEHFSIKLNGEDVPVVRDGWYLDRSFDKIRLPRLRQGGNELMLSCGYLNRMEVEDCYLIGDFGVDPQRNIVEEPKVLHFGDWCMQGYFHYCGSIIYSFDFNFDGSPSKKAVLELGEYSAVTISVQVNGESAGQIPWRAANGLELTGLLKPGNNQIDIEVVGSSRNLLGPLHQAGTGYEWTEWKSFRREGVEYTPDYVVKPYGLFGQICIYGD